MKKKTLITIALVAALAMVAAVTVYAVANYGSREDPLVTSSYLQDVVQPRMEDAYRSTLNGAIGEMEEQFADQVAAAGGTYVLVTLENGQTLTGRAGTEVRCGSHIRLDGCRRHEADGKPPVSPADGRRGRSCLGRHHRHGARQLQRRLSPSSNCITPVHSLVRE